MRAYERTSQAPYVQDDVLFRWSALLAMSPLRMTEVEANLRWEIAKGNETRNLAIQTLLQVMSHELNPFHEREAIPSIFLIRFLLWGIGLTAFS